MMTYTVVKGMIFLEAVMEIRVVQKDGFSRYMKRIGKLGGQNKVPRLTNDRKIANELKKECQ